MTEMNPVPVPPPWGFLKEDPDVAGTVVIARLATVAPDQLFMRDRINEHTPWTNGRNHYHWNELVYPVMVPIERPGDATPEFTTDQMWDWTLRNFSSAQDKMMSKAAIQKVRRDNSGTPRSDLRIVFRALDDIFGPIETKEEQIARLLRSAEQRLSELAEAIEHDEKTTDKKTRALVSEIVTVLDEQRRGGGR